MSFVKWWPTQHAFPRSAILTEMVSIAVAISSWLFFSEEPFLSREIPDTSWVRTSLAIVLADCGGQLKTLRAYAVFSRCFCTSSPLPARLSLIPSKSLIDFGGVVEAATRVSRLLSVGVAKPSMANYLDFQSSSGSSYCVTPGCHAKTA